MKKMFLLLFVVVLLCSCSKNEDIKVSEFSDKECENHRLELSEEFMNAYIEKNYIGMKPLVSNKFSVHSDSVDMKSDDLDEINATFNIIGENLEYQLDSNFEDGNYHYYVYQLDEKVSTGKLDSFKI